MKVLLTHGYFLRDDPNEMRIMKPYPPMGLLFISAWLKKGGMEHTLYDTTFKEISALKSYLEIYQPGIIGFYTTLMTKLSILDIITFIRQSQVLKQTQIIVGGPDVRYNADNYLREGADIVVPGEGEETFAELVAALSSGDSGRQNLRKIKGINFIDNNGLLVQTDVRPPLDLREVPIPNYDYIDVNDYLRQWKVVHGFSSMTINSMRGCPYSCHWCSKSIYGNTCRRRSPEAIVKELIMLKNTFRPDQVWHRARILGPRHHRACDRPRLRLRLHPHERPAPTGGVHAGRRRAHRLRHRHLQHRDDGDRRQRDHSRRAGRDGGRSRRPSLLGVAVGGPRGGGRGGLPREPLADRPRQGPRGAAPDRHPRRCAHVARGRDRSRRVRLRIHRADR